MDTAQTLILHGHFYQPPRENPDTGLLPVQETSYPKDNWNVRITDECYSANAYSRYLTYDGRIERICNNYEYISFNFGPTLLHWLRVHREDVYDRILQADAVSAQRLDGCGNAIAQAFNHTILPLDDPSDAELQLTWGLEDFSFHFGRDAEGIWLPETAVNDMVLDTLIRLNMKFIILSPWQAQRLETAPGEWKNLGKHPADFSRSYILSRPAGDIAVFFYHPGLAEGISFGHYLRDADMLYTHMKEIFSSTGASLVHTATDGEIYGHHEPFGDMCLAALIQRIQKDSEISFGNYSWHLKNHTPKLHAELRKGEEGRGTSWSCFHGVSRWYKDCGCSTGGEHGWNQKWRTPLRKGLQHISSEMSDLFEQRTGSLGIEDHFNLRLQYGKVLSGRTGPKEFARTILGDSASDEQCAELMTLLEGEKYRHFMFTSCGWFFSDISGIEPRQNLLYALYGISLYRTWTQDNLVHLLEDMLHSAKSNSKASGRGSAIFRTIADAMLPPGVEAACFFVLNQELTREEERETCYGSYRLIQRERSTLGGEVVEIVHGPTLEKRMYTVVTEFDRVEGLLIHCREEFPENGPFTEISMDMLGSFLCSMLFTWIDRSLERVTDNDIDQIYHDMTYYTGISKQTTYQPDSHFYIANMGTCMRTLNSLFRMGISYQKRNDFDLIQSLLDFIFQRGGSGEKETTNRIISTYLLGLTEELLTTEDEDLFAYVKDLLVLTRDSGFVPDITRLQNAVYQRLTSTKPPPVHLLELALQAGISDTYF